MVILLICFIGVIIYSWRFNDNIGSTNVGYLASIGLIFTASLDLGIIMLPPITDNSGLAKELGITYHHALEMSLWAGLIWMLYLVGIFYFRYIESRYHFLEYKSSKILFSAATFFTYAFSIQLFKDTLPQYTEVNPYIYVGISLLVAIWMYMYPKQKLVLTKWMIPAILFLPALALIYGADYDYKAVLSLPEAQVKVWTRLDNPDVKFFALWWGCWALCTARYLYSSVTKTKVSKLGVMVVLVPLALVVPWISVDMTLDQINSHPLLNKYVIWLAILFLSSSIVAMMYTTNEVFELSDRTKSYSSYLSIMVLIAVTVSIYLIHISLYFILSLYGLSILFGFLNYSRAYYLNNKSK